MFGQTSNRRVRCACFVRVENTTNTTTSEELEMCEVRVVSFPPFFICTLVRLYALYVPVGTASYHHSHPLGRRFDSLSLPRNRRNRQVCVLWHGRKVVVVSTAMPTLTSWERAVASTSFE